MDTLSQLVNATEVTPTLLSHAVSEILSIVGSMFVPVSTPSTWLLQDIKYNEQGIYCYWISVSELAVCSHCNETSISKSNTYYIRAIQDLPINKKAVYHIVRVQRYNCLNQDCNCNNFFEQYPGFIGKYGRITLELQDYICRLGVESSAEGAARILNAQGFKITGDTVLKIVKQRGLKEMDHQLKNSDIKVLGCDDINRRKGNSSSACTVFINVESKQFLTLVPGKTADVVTNFLNEHPSVEKMTRDRATAYASAANKAGLEQVADRFHLFDNLHQAIKKEINLQLPIKVLIGDISREPDQVEVIDQENVPDESIVLTQNKSKRKTSRKSIAEPFKDTILRMFNEGKKHREIFKQVQREGFSGSRNCIYQYLKKNTDGQQIPRSKKPTSNECSRSAVYSHLIKTTSAVLAEDREPTATNGDAEQADSDVAEVEQVVAAVEQKEIPEKKTSRMSNTK